MSYMCKNCESHNKFKVREVGAHCGLYCKICGRWQKWLSKEEREKYEDQKEVGPPDEDDDVEIRFHIWSDAGIAEQILTCRRGEVSKIMQERTEDLCSQKEVFMVTASIRFLRGVEQ